MSEHDPVVGEHYAGFDFRNARMIELPEAKLVYLSYRMGNRIFWTRHKVSLRKGERLITDGMITARTRCANQVSPVAVEAIAPNEPPLEAFEEPILMAGSAIQIPFPEAALPLGPEAPPLTPPNPIPGGGFPPLVPPAVPVPICQPTKTKPGGKLPPCTKPVSPVPEPGTMLLMASGMLGVLWRYRKSFAGH